MALTAVERAYGRAGRGPRHITINHTSTEAYRALRDALLAPIAVTVAKMGVRAAAS